MVMMSLANLEAAIKLRIWLVNWPFSIEDKPLLKFKSDSTALKLKARGKL